MVRLLDANQVGMILQRDELSGWLSTLLPNRRGGNTDRTFFLEAYNGKVRPEDRATGTGTVMIAKLGHQHFRGHPTGEAIDPRSGRHPRRTARALHAGVS